MRSPHKGYILREQSKTAVNNFFWSGGIYSRVRLREFLKINPEVRESRNPENSQSRNSGIPKSQKSQSRNFGNYRILKISGIPKFGNPEKKIREKAPP